jgi:hypothetical protein
VTILDGVMLSSLDLFYPNNLLFSGVVACCIRYSVACSFEIGPADPGAIRLGFL